MAARHDADYDQSRMFSRIEALDHIEDASLAIQTFLSASRDVQTELIVALLLPKPKR